MAPHYRADQVGSLLRPSAVLEAHARSSAGDLPPEDLRRIEDEAILAALTQQETGIDVVTDGEYRRGGWASDFCRRGDGLRARPAAGHHPLAAGIGERRREDPAAAAVGGDRRAVAPGPAG
ncbi:MAG: hypothetical protein U0531_12060 [Dehalococcoidia bacterium]